MDVSVVLRQESQVYQKSVWILNSFGWQKKDTDKSTDKLQCTAWMHRMRTLPADFVDAAVDGLSEIKLPLGWKQPGGSAHGASARRAVAVLSGALPLEV
ncbi:hypothetical protein EH244_12200 [Variovorax beijingensis]|uniref:Uncharacterized protein n=1 Tax=Variovorax beijingensis TaxID=2496117 RepID=A0A3P3EPZ5_9BURK|nr:hypothetical protein [Variovorax beijingensis]RRH88395.1 hypothetical protein EH244_12200 [Variovorax beijingensis]